jgi:hypothetical protein
MKRILRFFIFILAAMPIGAVAQNAPVAAGGPPTKTTFVRFGGRANGIIVERETPDPVRSRIAILVTHPEHINNFNYFHGLELAKYGYRVLLLNDYGPEDTYEEFLAPIAEGIKKLRATAGVEKVVLAGHSSGGTELTFYQDVAENGPAACQRPERIYKCQTKDAENLPKADGVIILDANSGAVSRMLGLNAAMNPHNPREIDSALDMFDAKNGYNPATGKAEYSTGFLKNYFAAQSNRANQLDDEALARLEKINKGEGAFKDDEPFLVAGSSGAGRAATGANPSGTDLRLLARTHAPHLLLKADGTRSVQLISGVGGPTQRPDDQDRLSLTAVNVTVRHYLSFDALRVKPDFRLTADNIAGIDWRSSGDSMEGNVEGIHVPTLVVAAGCGADLVLLEIAYDLSGAKDKEYVGVEGANHNMAPCRPEFGDTYKRAFDYMDSWLSKPGRF